MRLLMKKAVKAKEPYALGTSHSGYTDQTWLQSPLFYGGEIASLRASP